VIAYAESSAVLTFLLGERGEKAVRAGWRRRSGWCPLRSPGSSARGRSRAGDHRAAQRRPRASGPEAPRLGLVLLVTLGGRDACWTAPRPGSAEPVRTIDASTSPRR
jgi:hypothetical protein